MYDPKIFDELNEKINETFKSKKQMLTSRFKKHRFREALDEIIKESESKHK